MARKGEDDIEARSGVHGVSSSAWFEIMKVPVGKMPLCQGGMISAGLPFADEDRSDMIPPLA